MITTIGVIAIINIFYGLWISHRAEEIYVNADPEDKEHMRKRAASLSVNQLYIMVCIGLNVVMFLSVVAIYKLEAIEGAYLILALDVIFSQIITALSIECTRRRLDRGLMVREGREESAP